MFCSKCGNKLKESDSFCTKCGQAINNNLNTENDNLKEKNSLPDAQNINTDNEELKKEKNNLKVNKNVIVTIIIIAITIFFIVDEIRVNYLNYNTILTQDIKTMLYHYGIVSPDYVSRDYTAEKDNHGRTIGEFTYRIQTTFRWNYKKDCENNVYEEKW